jgi:hypothetical protein
MLRVLVEDRFGGGGARDDRCLVPLRDGGHDLGVSGSERREQEIDLVAGDELFGELAGALPIGLVVVLDQLDLQLLPADIDAAGGIDLRQPHLPGDVLLLGLVRERAGERQRRSELDHVGGVGGGRRDPDHGNARGENDCAGISSGCEMHGITSVSDHVLASISNRRAKR